MSDEDPLPDVGSLVASVDELASRVEVADTLARRQERLDLIVRWIVVACVFLVLSIPANIAISVVTARSAARTECRAANTANAKNAQFWRDLIAQYPAVPPGPDATQSEKDGYARAQARTTQFKVEVDALGAPRSC